MKKKIWKNLHIWEKIPIIGTSKKKRDKILFMAQEEKEKDLCKTCEHYWQDFPLPLEKVVSHCEILDKKYGMGDMDDVVPYPCLGCPFNAYVKKK